MSEQIGDAQIEEEYRAQMRAIAATIDEFLNGDVRPKRNGFCLLMFRMDKPGRCNYMSNASRTSVTQMLEGQVARFKLDDPLPPRVERAITHGDPFISWYPERGRIKLTGEFTPEELHALAWQLEKETK